MRSETEPPAMRKTDWIDLVVVNELDQRVAGIGIEKPGSGCVVGHAQVPNRIDGPEVVAVGIIQGKVATGVSGQVQRVGSG